MYDCEEYLYDTLNLAATNQIYCYDGKGNVFSFVNTVKMKVSACYDYGPFGELLRSTGEMAELNEYRFSTKRQDKKSVIRFIRKVLLVR